MKLHLVFETTAPSRHERRTTVRVRGHTDFVHFNWSTHPGLHAIPTPMDMLRALVERRYVQLTDREWTTLKRDGEIELELDP